MIVSLIALFFRELVRLACSHDWLVVGINPDGTVVEACRLCWHDRHHRVDT